MHLRIIQKIISLLLIMFSFAALPPLLVSYIYQDQAHMVFVQTLLITLGTGVAMWLPVAKHKKILRTRDGFVVVVLFWTILGMFGALPFYLIQPVQANWQFVDAVFESISGLTTTGATLLVDIESLPPSILFYRQFLQWLGGMGIIVLAVAILPMLGIGGMQLYRAETPGPVKDSKLTPRITETAKHLWYIYLTLTCACALAYWAAGMSLFDAISHSFSTVSIGGFSTHDDSIGYFDSAIIEIIAMVFMLLAAVNFSLHFQTMRTISHKRHTLSLKHYWQDEELQFFLSLIAGISLITVAGLMVASSLGWVDSLRAGLFQVISIATTTGFATASFANWPTMLPFLIFSAAFIGGCAGSTGGGIKVIRALIIFKHGLREVRRLIHPNAIVRVKLGGEAIPDRVTDAVWGFFSVYIVVFSALMFVLLATGMDQLTAWSAVGATINNLGPGLGDIANNFSSIDATAKWVLCFSMLLGRLEIFTLLVLLTPMFWRD